MQSSESEIKINQQWHLSYLNNITDQEFILKLKADDKIIEYKSSQLILKKSLSSVKPSLNVSYNVNQPIEFYSNNKWIEGQIRAQKGLFYLVTYIEQNEQCIKILGSDSIRELTLPSDCITLDIDKCVRISLKNWNPFPYLTKKINKLIDKLNKLLKDSISFIFSANSTLFVFGDNIEIDLLNALIDTSYNHFIELEKSTQIKQEPIFIPNTQANNKEKNLNHNVHKETLIIEKLIYDMQKPKIDQFKKSNHGIKIEAKPTKNSNEVSVSISSKDIGLFNKMKNILNLIQKYVIISIHEKDSFLTSQKANEKNLLYFANLYQIVDYNLFKNDDKSTTIRLIGQREMIDYFSKSVISFCEKNQFIKEKENTIAQIKHQILNLS